MKYIEKTLTSNESIHYTSKVSPWSFVGWILLSALIVGLGGVLFVITNNLVLLGIGILFLFYPLIPMFTTEIAVTNKRIIYKVGLIRRNITEITLSKVESLNISQSVLGRLLNYGSVLVKGTGSNAALMKGVEEPLALRAAIMLAVEPFNTSIN